MQNRLFILKDFRTMNRSRIVITIAISALAFLTSISTFGVESTLAPPLPATNGGTLIFAPIGDGRILMTGFTEFDPSLGTVNLPLVFAYDPNSNTYSKLADSIYTSSYGAASIDAAGNVIVNRQTIGRTERYLATSNSWVEVSNAISEGTQWSQVTATNGKDWTAAVSPYGLTWKRLAGATTLWETMAERPTTLIVPALCWDEDGALFTFGGLYPATWLGSTKCNRYNIETNSWTNISDMNQPRGGGSALRIDKNRFLVVGGHDSSEFYNIAANTWTQIGALTSVSSSWAYNGDRAPLITRLPNGRIMGNRSAIDVDSIQVITLPIPGPTMYPVYVGHGKLVWCGDRPTTWNLTPTIPNASLSVHHGTTINHDLAVITHAFDRNVSYEIASVPSHGSAVIANGVMTYTPNVGFAGNDQLIVRASDPTFGNGRLATIDLTMTNANPVVDDTTQSLLHDTRLLSFLPGSDADLEQLTWSITNGPASGVFSLIDVHSGYFQYVAAPAYAGTQTVTFTVSDGAASTTGTLTLIITNNPPVVGNTLVSVLQDSLTQGKLPGSDVDGDKLTWTMINGPKAEVFNIINADDNSYNFQNANGQFSDIPVTFSVSDGISSSQAVITFHILRVNHKPSFSIGPEIITSEKVIPQVYSNWVSNISVGPDYESDQQVLGFTVENDHAEAFLVAPSISNDGTLNFTPSSQLDQEVVVTLTIKMRDNGGTANGGIDLSDPITSIIRLFPITETFTVTNTLDAGTGSLRDCLSKAHRGDVITFDAVRFDAANSSAATVINVLSSLPTLNHGGVTIDATERRVTINGSAAGSSDGLLITSDANRIFGLTMVSFTGSCNALTDQASNNQLGGSRNVGSGPNGQGLRIANNGTYGIRLNGAQVQRNAIVGCWIGVSASGTTSEPNLAGILIAGGANLNTIGSLNKDFANRIAGNTQEGIVITDVGSDNNIIIGNAIGGGKNSDGKIWKLGNGASGVYLSQGTVGTRVGASGNGKDDQLAANYLVSNGRYGIEVRSAGAKKHAFRGNQITGNSLGGIGIFDGANDHIAAPVLTAMSDGNISGTATADGVIEFFNDQGDQGATFLGRTAVTGGKWNSAVARDSGQTLTATFTDNSGNTSTFVSLAPANNQGSASDNGNKGKCGLGSGIAALGLLGFLLSHLCLRATTKRRHLVKE